MIETVRDWSRSQHIEQEESSMTSSFEQTVVQSRPPRTKIMNSQIAFEIYNAKRYVLENKSLESSLVAAKYGISSKTVRDIWDRRTWAEATIELWTDREREEYEAQERRNPGRPPGSKDTKPRKKRAGNQLSSMPKQIQSTSVAISDNTDNTSCRSSIAEDASSADDSSKIYCDIHQVFQDSDQKTSSGFSESQSPALTLTNRSPSVDVEDTARETSDNGGFQTLMESERSSLSEETYMQHTGQLLGGSSDEWFVRPELSSINNFLKDFESSDP
eukprot:754228-Hanusia_phi.AAC.3